MSINSVRTVIATAALSLTLTSAWAQQAGHQMAGTAQASGGGAAMCAQNSQGVTRTIDIINARIEDARQTNDASKLRAAIGDLQSVFAQIKSQLADCVGLSVEAGGAMGNMPGMDHSKVQAQGTPVMQPGSPSPAPGATGGTPMAGMDHSKMPMAPAASATPPASAPAAGQMAGMDHSKMQMPAKRANTVARAGAKPAAPAAGMDHAKTAEAPASKAGAPEPSKMAAMDHSKMAGDKVAAPAVGTHGNAASAAAVVFTVRTDPAPPRSGKNDFEVTLKDAEGKPIADAAVSLAFYMPAMPSMKTDAAQLTSTGNGVYKGSGTVGMSGDWDVTITASRKGQTLATKKVKLNAK